MHRLNCPFIPTVTSLFSENNKSLQRKTFKGSASYSQILGGISIEVKKKQVNLWPFIARQQIQTPPEEEELPRDEEDGSEESK
jgi:hypothetical protein